MPFNAHAGAHRAIAVGSRWTPRFISKKEHTPSSLSRIEARFGWPQDFVRTLADWLGSVVKPLGESGKTSGSSASGSGFFGHEKTHFRVEVGRMRVRVYFSVSVHTSVWLAGRRRDKFTRGAMLSAGLLPGHARIRPTVLRSPEGRCNMKSFGLHGGERRKGRLLGYNGRTGCRIKGWLELFLIPGRSPLGMAGSYQLAADLP